MYRILLWGAGSRSRYFMNKNLFDDCEIIAVVDTYYKGSDFMGYKVIQPDNVMSYDKKFDYIVICNQFYQEIIANILILGGDINKIVITDNNIDALYVDFFKRLEIILPKVYEYTKNSAQRTIRVNERDLTDQDTFVNNSFFSDTEYNSDYFRYRTFEFIADNIIKNGIKGEIAELGVFRGAFSALLNYKFSDRKIYLFDTFEGFNDAEAKNEVDAGRCVDDFISYHKDTSIDRMLGNLPYPDQAIVCQGFFPASVTEDAKRQTYAFVSLDVDFEESTYEGLKFFYPRLAEGGYIFIHDYNTYFLEGISVAVARYEDYIDERLKVVPIADRAGTLIVLK